MNTRLALCDASGPLTGLLENLSGHEAEKWLTKFKNMLSDEDVAQQPPVPPQAEITYREFPVWKTINVGFHNDIKAVIRAFEKSGYKISNSTKQIMGKPAFVFSEMDSDVELVAVSGYDLGFTIHATCAQIYKRATETFKLGLCQPEDGIYLREMYIDQPNDEWRLMAMKPISDSGENLSVFLVGRTDDEFFLNTDLVNHFIVFHPSDVWVFRRLRK